MRGAAASASLALIAILAVASCGKRVGGSCKAGESTCIAPGKALTCRGGKFVEVACTGPLACTTYQKHANCDDSSASDGDACMGDGDDEYACTPDKKRALVCKSGRFERYLDCRGAAGCASAGRNVTCDDSISEKGDPCKKPGALACSADEKQVLVCRDGKFAVHRYCRGKNGCELKPDGPSCDQTTSLEQDPCGLPGQVVCSLDGKTELICQNGIFMKSRSCKKNGCTVTNRPGHAIECK